MEKPTLREIAFGARVVAVFMLFLWLVAGITLLVDGKRVFGVAAALDLGVTILLILALVSPSPNKQK